MSDALEELDVTSLGERDAIVRRERDGALARVTVPGFSWDESLGTVAYRERVLAEALHVVGQRWARLEQTGPIDRYSVSVRLADGWYGPMHLLARLSVDVRIAPYTSHGLRCLPRTQDRLDDALEAARRAREEG